MDKTGQMRFSKASSSIIMYIELQSNIALIKALLHVKIPGKTTDVRENENEFRKGCQSSRLQYEKTELMERMI